MASTSFNASQNPADLTVSPNGDADFGDRLDENYLFLLNFVDRNMEGLSEEQRSYATNWLVKLGTGTGMETRSITAKSRRNTYLGKLITCMQQKQFEPPFNANPPQEPLPPLEWVMPTLAETPEWLERIMNDEANKVHVGGKNFETYVSTKMFEGGRGACAYVAVSAKNEGDNTAWAKIQPNRYKEIEKMMQKEIAKHQKLDESKNSD